MNIFNKLFLVLVTYISVISCENTDHYAEMDSTDIDSLDLSLDSSATVNSLLDAAQDQEQEEITQKIVATYGEQWDFCTCIAKNDSIDKAIFNNDLSDEELDFLLVRMNQVEEKCKLMISGSQGTPDERKQHEKKVKDCLK
jgi:hypothetical protein